MYSVDDLDRFCAWVVMSADLSIDEFVVSTTEDSSELELTVVDGSELLAGAFPFQAIVSDEAKTLSGVCTKRFSPHVRLRRIKTGANYTTLLLLLQDWPLCHHKNVCILQWGRKLLPDGLGNEWHVWVEYLKRCSKTFTKYRLPRDLCLSVFTGEYRF